MSMYDKTHYNKKKIRKFFKILSACLPTIFLSSLPFFPPSLLSFLPSFLSVTLMISICFFPVWNKKLLFLTFWAHACWALRYCERVLNTPDITKVSGKNKSLGVMLYIICCQKRSKLKDQRMLFCQNTGGGIGKK